MQFWVSPFIQLGSLHSKPRTSLKQMNACNTTGHSSAESFLFQPLRVNILLSWLIETFASHSLCHYHRRTEGWVVIRCVSFHLKCINRNEFEVVGYLASIEIHAIIFTINICYLEATHTTGRCLTCCDKGVNRNHYIQKRKASAVRSSLERKKNTVLLSN